jgi:hypothetical protein
MPPWRCSPGWAVTGSSNPDHPARLGWPWLRTSGQLSRGTQRAWLEDSQARCVLAVRVINAGSSQPKRRIRSGNHIPEQPVEVALHCAYRVIVEPVSPKLQMSNHISIWMEI